MGVAPGPDGTDLHFAANHLGPYMLTRLMLPLMAHGSRVVNVASRAHFGGWLAVDADRGALRDSHTLAVLPTW
jgi:NAD(P)-dependent dehydrogenase (short-subunit alcohol dehydrogenase family)